MNILYVTCFLFLVLPTCLSAAPSPITGLWYTHPSSQGVINVVEIFEEEGKLYGYGLSHKNPQDNLTVYDIHNPDPSLRHQELTGLIFIHDVAMMPSKTQGKGYIYSPENGKTYYIQLKLKNTNTLVLKPTLDALGVLGPNIVWKRVEKENIYTPLPRNELRTPYKDPDITSKD